MEKSSAEKILKAILFGDANPVRGLFRGCARGFSAPGRADVWGDIRSIPARARQIRAEREITDETPMEDWATIEKLWGFTERQRSAIIRGMTLECVLWAAAIVLAWAFAFSWPTVWTGGSALILTSGLPVCILARAWRISVLRKKQFISFSAWLRELFFSGKED